MISHSTPLGAVLFSCLTLPRMPVYLLVALPAHEYYVVDVEFLLFVDSFRYEVMQLCVAGGKWLSATGTPPNAHPRSCKRQRIVKTPPFKQLKEINSTVIY